MTPFVKISATTALMIEIVNLSSPNSAKDWHRQQRDENEHERGADDVTQAPEIGSRPAAVSAECRNQTSGPGDAEAEAREGQEVELVSHAARVGERSRKTASYIAVFPILMLSSLPHICEVPNPEPVPVSSYRALSIAPRLREACGRGLVGSARVPPCEAASVPARSSSGAA
jgi:hypothetical protein